MKWLKQLFCLHKKLEQREINVNGTNGGYSYKERVCLKCGAKFGVPTMDNPPPRPKKQ